LLKQEGQIELLSKPIKENPHLKHFGGNAISKKKSRTFEGCFTTENV
tara:strand:- start:58 stop:198 length:141 start_codon:yes stop_codon:yes gene_type:complete